MMNVIFLMSAASTDHSNPRRGPQGTRASDFCVGFEYDEHHFSVANQAAEVSFEGNDHQVFCLRSSLSVSPQGVTSGIFRGA
ncbi:hypothetical protein J2W88_004589 [Acidovorax delafieldii]|uniref:Uncharacterized protein n=1 Tax=Acidovorax delafieldii TaxID=47920 RepID=A0AAJ2BWT0_ACIDE|nr:hypothetical protein [Acidovorax delafieldii]MDR6769281.1 hypothetical protein [Acidovorax delafieldii]MDR6839646.1 hypothetical protein [Acidovorax delafieldii]